ncbi:DNA topoisomerase 2-alpha [Dirofilaria immitis]|nr:DNA topoisomerase 2-alpha [Dirofilaria immitis]
MSNDEESDYNPPFASSPQKKQVSKKQIGKLDKSAVKRNKHRKRKQMAIRVIMNGDKNDDGDPLDIFTNIDQHSKRLSIEKIYQKKSQLEHILLRPDTYIGSVERTDKAPMWIYDAETERIVQRDISYVPGLYKIFDEILVNAADNKQRDPKMNLIKININKETNEISVFNNGKGIPVVLHKVEQLYVPELIFGTLLTSSNYDDSERKVTGGRNGYGAKLCNIFSTEFTVETSSKEYGKAFKQTWKNNMTKDKDPFINKSSGEDFTRITFKPDLTKFKMAALDNDIISLISRRAYDVAGSTKGVKVYLNGKLLPVQGFKQYVDQYARHNLDSDGEPFKVAHEQVNERWEIALTVSEKGFQQVSFVNSIATTKGGRHVDYVADQITAKLIDTIKKKVGKSGVNVKPFQIKSHMWIFVNSLIENPTFDSQTKETMTLQAKSFGSKCELSERFINAVMKCGIVEAVLAWVRFKQQETLDKKCSSKKTRDSAKSLAVSGLGVVGRDRYGVFPLRGKMLNVREGSHKQIMENAEINALIKIIGLQYRLKYDKDDDMKTLRYGKVMVMADQDQDGSHIKGLVINFIHYNWPILIRRNFVEEFITPIVKATKGKESFSFFSLPEYAEWRNNTENWKTYRIKYYKGLGTSTSKEAKEYFSDMVRHRIRFQYAGEEDDNSLDMAFRKKARREQGLTEEYLYDKDTRAVSFKDFVNKELVLFSNADNERSIPSLVDGLKPGQRKVLFTCFKRADKKEVKVAQLAGAVGEMSAYHHGEASLMSTIVNLAQDYVGSNNINLLLPIGQFGTRLQGGKDSASPRYIFTQLNPVTRAMFPAVDENVLRFLFEENQRIEPEWYCPIIPTVLVNGAEGIGTAWSTKIPNYNPREIVNNMRRLIRGEEPEPLMNRDIFAVGNSSLSDDTIEITELPIRTWTQNYKESVLESMLEGSDKQPPLIQDFKEYHTDTTVKFVIKMNASKLREAEMEGLHKIFKLQTTINISSMVLFDPLGCLRRFSTVEEICKEFFEIRKKKYIERKAFQEGMLRAQSERLSNQARFILAKIKGEILIENKRKAAIVEQLVKKRWKEWQRKRELEMTGEVQVDDEEIEGEEEEESESSVSPTKKDLEKKLNDYDYLVGMAILKLSEEEKDKLLRDSEQKLEELKVLESKTWSDLWEQDLDNFLVELEKQEAKERADIEMQVKDAAKKLLEVLPDPNGIRIQPSLDAIKEKYESKKIDESKPRKPRDEKKEKKPKRSRKENGEWQFIESKKKKRDEWESNSSEHDFNESDYVIDDDDDDVIEIKKTTPGDRKRRMEESASKLDMSSTDVSVNDSLVQSSDENIKKFHEKMDDLFMNEKASANVTKKEILMKSKSQIQKETKRKAKTTIETNKKLGWITVEFFE